MRRVAPSLPAAAIVGLGVLWLASTSASSARAQGTATAVFAGGCFWCMEKPFEVLPGVASVTSGYAGGQKKNPTYEEVSAGITGHTEAVQIVYDPTKTSYKQLLEVFWRNIDPLSANGQFCDRGSQYRAAIFYGSDAEKMAAEESKAALEADPRFKGKIVTQIVPAATFYPAEDYHQDFYKKNPVRYNQYRWGCGRDARLKELWGEKVGARK